MRAITVCFFFGEILQGHIRESQMVVSSLARPVLLSVDYCIHQFVELAPRVVCSSPV